MKTQSSFIIVGILVLIGALGMHSDQSPVSPEQQKKIISVLQGYLREHNLDAKNGCGFKPESLKIVALETEHETEIHHKAAEPSKYTKNGYLIGGKVFLTKDIICKDLNWKDLPEVKESSDVESCTTIYFHNVKFEVQGPKQHNAYMDENSTRPYTECSHMPDEKDMISLSGIAKIREAGPWFYLDRVATYSGGSQVKELQIR